MPFKLVSITLLTWNGSRFIESCVDSISQQDYPNIELIVVDNGSTDGSVSATRDILKKRIKYPWKLELLPFNTGFANGMNRGFALSSGDYILTLNQDLVMKEDFVSKLVKGMEITSNYPIGSASGKILKWSVDTNNREKIIDSAGHVIFTDRIVEGRGKGKNEECFNESCAVFGVSASAAMYSRKALESVSIDGEIFDREFFSYLEDVDLDYRLILKGYEARYVSDALAWHAGAGSGGRKSFSIRFKAHTNRYLVWVKNERVGWLIRDFIPIFGQEIFQLVRTLFTSPLLLLSWFTFLPKALRLSKKARVLYADGRDYERFRSFLKGGRLSGKLMKACE